MEHGKGVIEEGDVPLRHLASRGPGTPDWRWIGAGAAVVAAGALGWYLAVRVPSESTDDAFIEAHVVPVSARVSGHVARVLVDDNRVVKEGERIVEIDARDFQTRLDQARAKAASARAEAAKTQADLKRAKALFAKDEASHQDLEHAQAASDGAAARLADTEAALRQAELDLSYTKIEAPVSGRVTRKGVEPGTYVQLGQAMLALVPDDTWVVANFKETQLTRMRPGQPASVVVDAYPDQRLHGRVDSIQAGTGARFSLLPAENASGNFVKVVQRVPVKILLEDRPTGGRLLSPGMSVDATVELR